jgi:ATP-binding cassette subfamily F protein uup
MAAAPKSKTNQAVPPPAEKSGEKRKASFKEKQEYEKLQAEIDSFEGEKQVLTAKINGGTSDHKQLIEWSERIRVISNAIEEKTLRWLELSELI